MPANPLPRCVILGGGGHARVVLDCLQAGGAALAYGILDREEARWGTQVMGVPVLGGDERLADVAREGVTLFIVGLGAVGDNGPRRALFELAQSHGLTALTVRHPSAVCSRWATIGAGSVLCPSAVVNAGAVIGVDVIINSGAIIEHDCVVGDHAHVATGARLSGAVRVGEAAHVGAGATVRQGCSIGEGAVVGAGAVVVDEVAPGTVVAGVPARPLVSASVA